MTRSAQPQLAPFKKPFIALARPASRMPPHRPAARMPLPRRAARILTPVDTKAALKKAEDAHYEAEEKKEKRAKQIAVTKAQEILTAAKDTLRVTKALEAKKKAEKDMIPDTEGRKLAAIEQHNDAGAKFADANDAHVAATAAHKDALANAQEGGRRRRRKTRRKRRKSKHRRRKRHTKKRKRNTKRRKKHTKRRRRSRRRGMQTLPRHCLE